MTKNLHYFIYTFFFFFILSSYSQNDFITTWKTDNPGASDGNQITIPTHPDAIYNYTVEWGDGSSDSNVTGNITHTYESVGEYTVSISGEFPRIYFNGELDANKIITVNQWGDIEWKSMEYAFSGCQNVNVNADDIPDLGAANSLSNMFHSCYSLVGNLKFNDWNVSNIQFFDGMFSNALLFNQDIGAWNVSKAKSISLMFNSARLFNQDIGDWKVDNVETMELLFFNAFNFNQDIGRWNVSSVFSMGYMFSNARLFNQDIGNWNVGVVRNMAGMFNNAFSFNHDISSWDVSQVETMGDMFSYAKEFNQPINEWNVGNVANMFNMFRNVDKFNTDITSWNVDNATNMSNMFRGAELFNQDLSSWNISKVEDMSGMFDNSNLSNENYDKALIGWYQLPILQTGVQLDAPQNYYCEALEEHSSMISEYGWVINDAGEHCQKVPFTTTWKTNNEGSSDNNQITIPTHPDETYNYVVDWGDGLMDEGVTGDITHTYLTEGLYTVTIIGTFPRIYFNSENDVLKLISIDKWGDIAWTSMDKAFYGCQNMDVIADDVPDFLSVSSLDSMFKSCLSLVGNSKFNDWDVKNVQFFDYVFSSNILFNQDISNWNVSKATSMSYMFAGTSLFNQNISSWDVSSVENMTSMFLAAKEFNQPIVNWNVESVTNMFLMFASANKFNQKLNSWNVSNVKNMGLMFADSGLSNENYDNILIDWSQLPSLQGGVQFGANSNQYCLGEEAKQNLIDNHSWVINDAGKALDCPEPNDFVLNINTGGAEATYSDKLFIKDDYYNRGSTLKRPQTGLPEPYQSMRFSRSQQMAYNVPLENGEYTVKLHFAELWFGATDGGTGGAGSRVFDVSIEGQLAEDNLDVFSEVGAETMLVKTHVVTVTDGILNIDLSSLEADGGTRHPIINAIEILGDVTDSEPQPFVTTWKTDNLGVSGDNQITIPTHPNETYNYDIDWGDGSSDSGVTGNITHTYSSVGTYEVSIFGDFPAIWNNPNSTNDDREKLLAINQWGSINWFTLENAFRGCVNLDVIANDVPNLDMVTTLESAFSGCINLIGNEEFSNWDVGNVTQLHAMFSGARKFNQAIGAWDVSNVEGMAYMFSGAEKFNQRLAWNVSKVIRMDNMFLNAINFNNELVNWDVSNVELMSSMFNNAQKFNQDISAWQVDNVIDMGQMFANAESFNQPIGNWNVLKVYNMFSTFFMANSFNQPLFNWDVSSVEYMGLLFYGAESFNQDISNWDVSEVMDMELMFDSSGFSNENYDKALIGWSQLPSLQESVQLDAPQNQYCLSETARQNLINTYSWEINDAGKASDCPEPNTFSLNINTGGAEVTYNDNLFITDDYYNTGSTLKRPQTGLPEPYQSMRFSRSQQMAYNVPLENGEYTVKLYFAELWFGATDGGAGGAGSRVFDVSMEDQLAEDNLDVFSEVGAETMLVKTHIVTVTDGILNIDFSSLAEVGGKRHPIINAIEILGDVSESEPRPFVTTWKTDNEGVSENNQITIPTHPDETYNYSVDWGDGSSDIGVTEDITHSYLIPGTYKVSISGIFPRFYMSQGGRKDRWKILTIEQWGDIKWTSMNSAFASCPNLNMIAKDVPDFSLVTSTREMFSNCGSLVGVLSFSAWNVGNVTNMGSMFADTQFNQEISNWNVSNVQYMDRMFFDTPFNQNIDSWDVGKVENMSAMFQSGVFNQNINLWDVGNVIFMSQMFAYSNFNQNIGDWDVRNVERMAAMFEDTPFNQDIGNWDLVSLKHANSMFRNATAFNQDLSNWDVSSLISFHRMFEGTSFNFDLGKWNVSSAESMRLIFNNAALSNENYDSTLIGWSQLPILQEGVQLGAPQNKYCLSEEARQSIVDTYGWEINDAGKSSDCPEPNAFSLNINTGGAEATYNDNLFIADDYYNTGSTLKRPQTGLSEPYQTFRYSRSQQMAYNVPLENGEYIIKLHFAELWFGATGGGSGGIGSRVFDVSIENELLEDNLDVYAEVGADAILVKTHIVTVTDGILNIDFSSLEVDGGTRHPIINAIEILGNTFNINVTENIFELSKKQPIFNNLMLVPNPASEQTTASFDFPVNITEIMIFDVHGRLIHTYDAREVKNGDEYKLDVYSLMPGLHFVRTVDENGVLYQKQLIIKK